MRAAGTKPAQKIWNLLLVEDNPADRLMLQSAFQEAGVQCHWTLVDSGVKAMRIASSSTDAIQPDVILLDWQLPGATGLEVLASLKRNSNLRSVPVIMFTGMSSPFHVNAAAKAGAQEVLEKPMLLSEWLKIPAQIENVLPRRCVPLHS